MMPFASAMLALMSVVPASIIAANSFVGEKEQRTLEPLLLTPLTDQQIIVGKLLSAFIPCVILIYGGTLVTSIAISVIMLMAGRPLIMFPDLPGMFLIFVVGPIVVLGTVATMILISSRVSRVYEAYQTGSITALILLIPFFLPLMGMQNNTINIEYVWMSDIITFLIAVTIAAVTWLLALKQFNRDRMISMV
ncbi:MAG: ABC transporter permease subunit [Candidatus Thorarchaeota archaeon]|nr:ABC transporter permease subunit [Candidatus Thorarchaeota archaeon]